RGLSGQQESTEQRSMTIAATTTKPQLPAPADASAREPVRLEPSSVSVEKSTPLPVQVAQNVDISSTSTGATPDPEPVVAQRQPSVMVDKMREERSAPIAQTSSTDIGAQTKSASIGAVASTKDNGSSQPAPTTNQIVLSPFAKDHAMVREARALFAEGEDNLAYRKLYDFLAAHEQDDQSRALLAGQLMQEGRYAEAGDVLLAVRDIDNPDLRQMKARWYMHQGESDLALHTLRERQPELTGYPEYYALLASYYQQMGYPQQAARLYGKLVEFDADAADWWAGLAIALDRQSRFEEGKLAYSRAIQLPGLNPSLQDFIQQRLNALTQ
ncbi:MAG: tetratricopeptide repeat protein, partial [Oleiphilaceae bacterium]|nr:tetratricopeptide repeat protein [Oleiphilaceae bacterium]